MEPIDGIVEAICTSLQSPPIECLEAANIKIVQNSNNSTWMVLSIMVVFLIIAMSLGMVICKKSVKKEMNQDIQLQINAAISQYFALNDSSRS